MKYIPFILVLFVGCRTAGPQLTLRDCSDCVIYTHGATEAEQGKSLQGEMSPGVAAQVADNVVAQQDASKVGDSENTLDKEPDEK